MALRGIKVVELVGLAPAPFCGLILSDFGANVIRVDRVNRGSEAVEPLKRGKKSIALDLKQNGGRDALKALCRTADVLIEPFRPGVMEKLGLGPTVLSEFNKRLIFARLSGFGQSGPLSKLAGHDINYLAISGVLSILGQEKPANPNPPINLLADFAGGGLLCALGVCIALLERATSGLGQVVDANLTEGTGYVSTSLWATRKSENIVSSIVWPRKSERGRNLLDGGAPFYNVYKTKDDKYMAIGSLEPQFYQKLLFGLGLNPDEYQQEHIHKWDSWKDHFAKLFAEKTQEEWTDIFSPLDCCITPVVDFDEAAAHFHNKARGSFLEDSTPRPAPVLDRTPANPTLTEPRFGQHTEEILSELGYSREQLLDLIDKEAIAVDEDKGLSPSPKSKL